ncbi:MAG: serine hydrolase, partial [Bacteroidota bacterium]
DNWVEWALNLPMAGRAPGSEWAYFTAGVVLLGDILDQQVPGGLEAYTERKLFGPLGIEDYRWQQTPQGVGNTAGGLGMRARDLAKFGQLYQNGGRWQGQQVLPQSWVNESLQKHFVLPFDGLSYGYLFWHKSYQVGEKTYLVFACSGNGGNKVFVFTEIPVVVVVTARAYNQSYMHRQVDEMMDQYILPAILKE